MRRLEHIFNDLNTRLFAHENMVISLDDNKLRTKNVDVPADTLSFSPDKGVGTMLCGGHFPTSLTT